MSVAHWVPQEGATISVTHWVPQEGDFHVYHSAMIYFHFALISEIIPEDMYERKYLARREKKRE